MPVYSMTGYASAQHGAGNGSSEAEARPLPGRRLGLEIRSVNSRFLDLSFRLPDELRAMEPVLRSLLTAKIKRGKVEVRATLESGDSSSLPDPSPRMLQRLNSAQDAVRSWLPQATPLSVAEVLRLCTGQGTGAEDWSETVPALAEQALTALLDARQQEGARLATMLQGHLKQLRALAQQATPLVPLLVEQQRQRFMERWKEAMGLAEGAATPEAAQDRALSEATAFASMWPRKSHACNRTSMKSKDCSKRGAKSASDSISSSRNCTVRPTPWAQNRRHSTSRASAWT